MNQSQGDLKMNQELIQKALNIFADTGSANGASQHPVSGEILPYLGDVGESRKPISQNGPIFYYGCTNKELLKLSDCSTLGEKIRVINWHTHWEVRTPFTYHLIVL